MYGHACTDGGVKGREGGRWLRRGEQGLVGGDTGQHARTHARSPALCACLHPRAWVGGGGAASTRRVSLACLARPPRIIREEVVL